LGTLFDVTFFLEGKQKKEDERKRYRRCCCCCRCCCGCLAAPPAAAAVVPPPPALDDALALAKACISTASSALCAASTRPPPPSAAEGAAGGAEAERAPPPPAVARAAASSAAAARIECRVALSQEGTLRSSCATLRATSRSGEEAEGAPWSTGRDLSCGVFFFLRRGEGERVREQRRRRRRSKISALSPLLSLLLQAFLFSYLWPPRQDRRDDPVLGKLDPRGLPDARALLRGRHADVVAEPFFFVEWNDFSKRGTTCEEALFAL